MKKIQNQNPVESLFGDHFVVKRPGAQGPSFRKESLQALHFAQVQHFGKMPGPQWLAPTQPPDFDMGTSSNSMGTSSIIRVACFDDQGVYFHFLSPDIIKHPKYNPSFNPMKYPTSDQPMRVSLCITSRRLPKSDDIPLAPALRDVYLCDRADCWRFAGPELPELQSSPWGSGM